MGYSLPGSSVCGILQARILEWVVMLSSRGSSWPRDRTCVSYVSWIAGRFFTAEPLGKPNTVHIRLHFSLLITYVLMVTLVHLFRHSRHTNWEDKSISQLLQIKYDKSWGVWLSFQLFLAGRPLLLTPASSRTSCLPVPCLTIGLPTLKTYRVSFQCITFLAAPWVFLVWKAPAHMPAMSPGSLQGMIMFLEHSSWIS